MSCKLFLGMENLEMSMSVYIEVRYAKATCLSMNTQTANQFFKLRENGKKMAYKVYSDCLLKYLDSSKAVAKVSITDFSYT